MVGYEQAQEANDYLRTRFVSSSKLGLILGSGLSGVVERFVIESEAAYSEIPHWPVGGVAGHAGRLVLANITGTPVVVLAGRAHLYEGFSAAEVAFPVRVLAGLGVKTLIVTNAAGTIRDDWSPGQLGLISDHINLQGDNPLVGEYEERWGSRFPDMTDAYSPRLREAARQAAREAEIGVVEAVYAAVKGPSFETPAEVRYLRSIGADLVGMSTVPEVIVARQMGMEVLGISLISNLAAGLAASALSHQEVLASGKVATEDLANLVAAVVRIIAA